MGSLLSEANRQLPITARWKTFDSFNRMTPQQAFVTITEHNHIEHKKCTCVMYCHLCWLVRILSQRIVPHIQLSLNNRSHSSNARESGNITMCVCGGWGGMWWKMWATNYRQEVLTVLCWTTRVNRYLRLPVQVCIEWDMEAWCNRCGKRLLVQDGAKEGQNKEQTYRYSCLWNHRSVKCPAVVGIYRHKHNGVCCKVQNSLVASMWMLSIWPSTMSSQPLLHLHSGGPHMKDSSALNDPVRPIAGPVPNPSGCVHTCQRETRERRERERESEREREWESERERENSTGASAAVCYSYTQHLPCPSPRFTPH